MLGCIFSCNCTSQESASYEATQMISFDFLNFDNKINKYIFIEVNSFC